MSLSRRIVGLCLLCGFVWLVAQACGSPTGPQTENNPAETAVDAASTADKVAIADTPAEHVAKEHAGVSDASEPATESANDNAPPEGKPETQTQPEPVQEQASTDHRQDREVPGGKVSGVWCGRIEVKGLVTVDTGQTLTICEGSHVNFARSAGVVVLGTLTVQGTAVSGVMLTNDTDRWQGLQVTGELKGSYVTIQKAQHGIYGRQDSKISLDNSTLDDCGTALRLESGGTFQRVKIFKGGSLTVTGGMLKMTDSLVDFKHPKQSPDCTDFSGGGAELDHVRFTGCHCPIHINKTTLPVRITNSIFDDAAYPVMIANSNATFTGNHFLGGAAHILDIGGGSQVNVAGNYWGGGAPNIQTGKADQFTGTDQYAKQPFPNVGPR